MKNDESQEILLRLDQYDDIFSDFDVRPYDRRSLSSDFLEEIKRASNDKYNDGIELILHVSDDIRDESVEPVIVERLANHFKRHLQLIRNKKRKVLTGGWTMVLLGVIAMVLATRIIFEDPTGSAVLSFLVVFLEPAAWFLLWEGMDQILFSSKEVQPELDFYKKMSHSKGHIIFRSGNHATS